MIPSGLHALITVCSWNINIIFLQNTHKRWFIAALLYIGDALVMQFTLYSLGPDSVYRYRLTV